MTENGEVNRSVIWNKAIQMAEIMEKNPVAGKENPTRGQVYLKLLAAFTGKCHKKDDGEGNLDFRKTPSA